MPVTSYYYSTLIMPGSQHRSSLILSPTSGGTAGAAEGSHRMVNRLHVFPHPPLVVRNLSGSSSTILRRSHEAHHQVRTHHQLNPRTVSFEITDSDAVMLIDWDYQ